MSKQEKQMLGAMRIFEALSGVDEELLIRCEEELQVAEVCGKRRGKLVTTVRKVRPIWYYGKTLAACMCFVLMGALLWGAYTIMQPAKNASGSVDMAPAAAIMAPEAAMEEAACENETSLESAVEQSDTTAERNAGSEACDAEEAGTADSELKDVVTEGQIEDLGSVKQESVQQESAKTDGATNQSVMQGTPVDKRMKLTLKEAEGVAVLGEYVPTVIPAGYIFEGVWLTENNTTGKAEQISLCWLNGMDDIHINISYATEAVTTVDVSATETYDVHQYEIPYASTVPEEYRTVFNNPVFAEADFTQDIVERRMKSVADAGDTATPRGNFGVLYESGVLVEFSGNGDAESIYEMVVSGK